MTTAPQSPPDVQAAIRFAVTALDNHLGDTDLDGDDNPLVTAMQKLVAVMTAAHPTTRTAVDELLPCPFCGAAPVLHEATKESPNHRPVECKTKMCPMSFAWPDISMWNRRAALAERIPREPTELQAVIDDMEKWFDTGIRADEWKLREWISMISRAAVPRIPRERDADRWRQRFHTMRREVRRLNKTIDLFSKVMQLHACTNNRLREQLSAAIAGDSQSLASQGSATPNPTELDHG